MAGSLLLILALIAAAFLLGRYLRVREIQPPESGTREIPASYDGGRGPEGDSDGDRRGGFFTRPWVVAILVMVLVNGLLFLLLGPRGGFGLFLFLPLLFGLGRKR